MKLSILIRSVLSADIWAVVLRSNKSLISINIGNNLSCYTESQAKSTPLIWDKFINVLSLMFPSLPAGWTYYLYDAGNCGNWAFSTMSGLPCG